VRGGVLRLQDDLAELFALLEQFVRLGTLRQW
jgi:hypothetical protein